VATGVLAKYAAQVSSASRGAVTAPGPLDAARAKSRGIPVQIIEEAPVTPEETKELFLA
jgi:dihydroxy-acid dehydratase